jgi:drug/metabolite transporter (DMT)-like permease
MNLIAWVLSLAVALLTAVNAICWGYAIREVGDPQLSLNFLLTLVFNRWFILAMASAFTAALLSYAVLREMGVLAGRFFLSLGTVATILACTLVLGERLTLEEWVGIALIMLGVMLVGRW